MRHLLKFLILATALVAAPGARAQTLYVKSQGLLTADPVGACSNGVHYYNVTSNKERCCVGSAWADCSTPPGSAVANQCAYWSTTTTLAGSTGCTYNSGTGTITVNALSTALISAKTGGDLAVQLQAGHELDLYTNAVGDTVIGGGGVSSLTVQASIDAQHGLGVTGNTTLDGQVEFTSMAVYDQTNVSLANSQNNYALTRTATRITPTNIAGTLTITGLQYGSLGSSIVAHISNGSATKSIKFSNLSGSSQPQNQIITGTGSDVTIGPNQVVSFHYDVTSQKWRMQAAPNEMPSGCDTGTIPYYDNTTAQWHCTTLASGYIDAFFDSTSGLNVDGISSTGPSGHPLSWGNANFYVDGFSGETYVPTLHVTNHIADINGMTYSWPSGAHVAGGSLTDVAGNGILTWTVRANTALSNLASTAVNVDLSPGTDNTRKLGGPTLRWSEVDATSVVARNDAISTQFVSMGFSGANAARITTNSSTSLQLTTTTNAGITISTAGNSTIAGTTTFSALGAGLAHLSSGGVLSSSAVNLASSDVSGLLGTDKGGTGHDFTSGLFVPYGILIGGSNATAAMGQVLPGTASTGYLLQFNSGAAPSWVAPPSGVTGSGTTGQIASWASSSSLTSVATTGTGIVVLAASPTLTGTVATATISSSTLTASQAVFSDASKNLVSNAITGTGNVVMSASPTLTGTMAAAAATFSGNVTVSGRSLGGLSAVASANNLVLGSTNANTVSGTTQINLIDSTNWVAGTIVDVIFLGALTVKHNQTPSGANKAILLAASSDMTTSANTVLTLLYDGTNFQEVSRKVP